MFTQKIFWCCVCKSQLQDGESHRQTFPTTADSQFFI